MSRARALGVWATFASEPLAHHNIFGTCAKSEHSSCSVSAQPLILSLMANLREASATGNGRIQQSPFLVCAPLYFYVYVKMHET